MIYMTKAIRLHSSGGVVVRGGEVLLITWKTKDSTEFPKGTIEPGELSVAACIREVYEETGYRTRVIDSLGSTEFEYIDERDGRNYHKTVDYYLLELIDETIKPGPDRQKGEDFDNLWVSIDDAGRILTFDDARVVLARAVAHCI